MADNTKNRKNQQPAKHDQKLDRGEQSQQVKPDLEREPDRGKVSNNPQAGIDENDRMMPEAEVDDIDELDDVEDADEDRITQRNPAQKQPRPDQYK